MVPGVAFSIRMVFLVPALPVKSVVILGVAGFVTKVISSVSSARLSSFGLPPSTCG